MWWKIGSCLPSSLGSALLPQSLQGELSRACGPRPCPRQEVVRLPSSLDVIMARDHSINLVGTCEQRRWNLEVERSRDSRGADVSEGGRGGPARAG
jgi:hypothetical protein